VPVATWTGFYIGVNAGATFSGSSIIASTSSSDFGPFPSGFASAQAIGAYPTSLTTRRTSFIGGGQVGFNYQFGMLVAGFEADIQALPQRSTVSVTLQSCAAAGEFQRARVRHRDGGAPARLISALHAGASGCPLVLRCSMQRAVWLTAAPILPIPGRPASPSHRRSSSAARPPTAEPASVTRSAAASNTFWKKWSIKAEYLYYNLGRHSTTISGSFTNFAPPTGGFSTASVRDDGHIVRAGLNYRFGWGAPAPVVARY
jgi:outer membrane immunogenic protein